jgi:hypothetical protein
MDIPAVTRILEDFFKKVFQCAEQAANSAVKAEEAAQEAKEALQKIKEIQSEK